MRKNRNLIIGLLVGVLIGYSAYLTISLLRPYGPPPYRALAENPEISPYGSAEIVQEAFRIISAEVSPTIVEVSVRAEDVTEENGDREQPWNYFFQDPSEEEPGPQFRQSEGLGSGVIIESRGDNYYVITNSHVIGNAKEIFVELSDKSVITAKLVGVDRRKDLALLVFTSNERELPVIRIGDSDRVYVGDWVLAFGSPYGYESSVSSGIVSALGRRNGPRGNINDFIQTDASINQGNSGGALVNIRGELIGVNTFITTPNRGSIGLGFAIPVNNVKTMFRQLIDTGEVKYGWLGVSLGAYGREAAESLGYEQDGGVLVYQVFDQSPADKAGIKPGDLITALDGIPFSDTSRLTYRIGDKTPGDSALFAIERFGEKFDISVIIAERGEEESVRKLHGSVKPGFVPAPMTPDIRQAMDLPDDIHGVPVAEVYPRTHAQAIGLRAGDVITAVNGVEIDSLEELYKAHSGSRDYRLSVYRNGEVIELPSRSPISTELDP